MERAAGIIGPQRPVHFADPAAYLATPLLLFMVAVVACWIPASRAAGIDPHRALRHD